MVQAIVARSLVLMLLLAYVTGGMSQGYCKERHGLKNCQKNSCRDLCLSKKYGTSYSEKCVDGNNCECSYRCQNSPQAKQAPAETDSAKKH